jgi:plasmid replication initiation protein
MKNQELLKLDPEAPLGDKNVNMSNALARACHSLSLAEKRIIAASIAQTDSIPAQKLVLGVNQGWKVKLEAMDYARIFDLDADTAYNQLQEATKTLFTRYIRIMEDTKKGLKERRFHWISGMVYHHGEGWAELNFTPEVAPHLLALRSKFVTYKLKQASALRSAYSWRLFEYLQSWRDTGLWVVGIEEFAHAMDVPDKYRADFTDIRRRVIEPAVAELILKGGLMVEWKTRKAGRKVTGLEFKFAFEGEGGQPKEAKAVAKAARGGKKIHGVPVSEIEVLARPGESYEEAAARIALGKPTKPAKKPLRGS